MINFQHRLSSIDIFRAVTMFLMIFVNDLWSLKSIPAWLEHTEAATDGMGLADTIFPAFLYIVGLSIPFALSKEKLTGGLRIKTGFYILSRSFALLVMGFFHVNLEEYSIAAFLPKPFWQILITLGFFLVWLDYPQAVNKRKKVAFQVGGVIILIAAALLYEGGGAHHPETMKPSWWGILGLIGWAYLLAASIFFVSGQRLYLLSGALAFFLFFNIAANAGWLSFLKDIKRYVWIVGDGSMPALVMAGVITSVLYRRLAFKGKEKQCLLVITAIAFCMLGGGFYMRPFWGISKIRATPSWTTICTGISMLEFAALIYLTDIKMKRKWAYIIRPAGTSTLTCYLVPYIHYAFLNLIGVSLPLVFRTGGIGIIKSLLYSLIIIRITGMMEKAGIRLKI